MPHDPDHTPADDASYGLDNTTGASARSAASAGSAGPAQPAPPVSAARVVYCTHCGVDIQGMHIGQACPNCGTPVGKARQAGGNSSGKAIAALVLGICSIVGCLFYGVPGLVCGILAIYFARKVRQEIEAGEADLSAKGMSDAGRICGIIGTCLSALFVVLMIVYIIVFFVFIIPQTQNVQQSTPTWQSQPTPTPAQPAQPSFDLGDATKPATY